MSFGMSSVSTSSSRMRVWEMWLRRRSPNLHGIVVVSPAIIASAIAESSSVGLAVRVGSRYG